MPCDTHEAHIRTMAAAAIVRFGVYAPVPDRRDGCFVPRGYVPGSLNPPPEPSLHDAGNTCARRTASTTAPPSLLCTQRQRGLDAHKHTASGLSTCPLWPGLVACLASSHDHTALIPRLTRDFAPQACTLAHVCIPDPPLLPYCFCDAARPPHPPRGACRRAAAAESGVCVCVCA